MPEPISIISDQTIIIDEFKDFLRGLNIEIDPDEVYHGRLSEGNHHVWIVLDNDELKNFDQSEIELMKEKLGSQPKTHILLDVSKTEGSKQLAMIFIDQLSNRWNFTKYPFDASDEEKCYYKFINQKLILGKDCIFSFDTKDNDIFALLEIIDFHKFYDRYKLNIDVDITERTKIKYDCQKNRKELLVNDSFVNYFQK
ncbi:MAG: hypothetical protein AB4041_14760 [Microcystaceae cyanobacterium]